jgi:hypothetical protein
MFAVRGRSTIGRVLGTIAEINEEVDAGRQLPTLRGLARQAPEAEAEAGDGVRAVRAHFCPKRLALR